MELRAGAASAVVDLEHGGRLRSLRVDGLELLRAQQTDPMAWGCFPMAPWAGRIRRGRFDFDGRSCRLPVNLPPHAIHGTVFTRRWDDDLTIDLGGDWPWPGRVVQHVELLPDALHLRLEVHADGPPFPASCGWHPWFRRRLATGGDAQLSFDAGAMWVRDADGIPSGELVDPPPGPWDDCFTDLRGSPRIEWPGALTLTVESACPHVVVFDEPVDALCVEPQTHPPDALNLGAATVEPGRPLVAEATLRWS